MRVAWRRSRTMVLLTALVATIALVMPFGQTAMAGGPGEWDDVNIGRIRIVTPGAGVEPYNVGDEVSVTLRMESDADAPRRRIVGSSDDVPDAANCNWTNFPAGTAGRYNCDVTYTITEADVAAGEANFSVTYTQTPVDEAGAPTGADPIVTVFNGTLPVAAPASEFMELALTRTDDVGEPVRPGDTLTFDISYRNLTNQTITAFPVPPI